MKYIRRPDRGIRFAHDSPLEETGFEPSVQGHSAPRRRCVEEAKVMAEGTWVQDGCARDSLPGAAISLTPAAANIPRPGARFRCGRSTGSACTAFFRGARRRRAERPSSQFADRAQPRSRSLLPSYQPVINFLNKTQVRRRLAGGARRIRTPRRSAPCGRPGAIPRAWRCRACA